ncbi:MAG: hypothetical protein MUF87_17485 [Anaerolineae bacterium]|jgi:hypothetical protein|nr:hypothetical protein [Anaerolineae bacterium]
MLKKLISFGVLIGFLVLLVWFYNITPIWFPQSRPEYVMIGLMLCAIFPIVSVILILLTVFLSLCEQDEYQLTLYIERKLRHLQQRSQHDWDYLEAQVLELDKDHDPPYQR